MQVEASMQHKLPLNWISRLSKRNQLPNDNAIISPSPSSKKIIILLEILKDHRRGKKKKSRRRTELQCLKRCFTV